MKAKCDNAYEVLSICVGWNRCLCVHSSFHKWVLSTYYMPGTVVGTEDNTVNKTQSLLMFYGLFNLGFFSACICIPTHFHVQ